MFRRSNLYLRSFEEYFVSAAFHIFVYSLRPSSAPWLVGCGVLAAGLATTCLPPGAPAAPAACSKNADLVAMYTRHFRARDVQRHFRFVHQCGSWSGSRRCPAGESIAKSTFDGKMRDSEYFVFTCLPNRAKRFVFTVNSSLLHDRVFAILIPNWPTPLLTPRGACGIQLVPNLILSGSNVNPIG